MADKKIHDLTAATILSAFDIQEWERDPTGTPSSVKAAPVFAPLHSVIYTATPNNSDLVHGIGTWDISGSGKGSKVIPANTIKPGTIIGVHFSGVLAVTGGGSDPVTARLTVNGASKGGPDSTIPLGVGGAPATGVLSTRSTGVALVVKNVANPNAALLCNMRWASWWEGTARTLSVVDPTIDNTIGFTLQFTNANTGLALDFFLISLYGAGS